MPDVGAVRRHEEADACKNRPANGCSLPPTGPAYAKQSKEKRHGDVHDPVGSCTNDTSGIPIALQRPVVMVVLLEYAVRHGKVCTLVRMGLQWEWRTSYPISVAAEYQSLIEHRTWPFWTPLGWRRSAQRCQVLARCDVLAHCGLKELTDEEKPLGLEP